MAMTKNHWPPRLNVIKVAVSIYIVQVWAFRVIYKNRIASYTSKSAYGTVHTAWHKFLCFFKKSLRTAECKTFYYSNFVLHLNVPQAPIASKISCKGCATQENIGVSRRVYLLASVSRSC